MALAANETTSGSFVLTGGKLVLVAGPAVTSTGGLPRDADGRLVVKAL